MTATVSSAGMSIIGPIRKENQDILRLQMPADLLLAETRGSLFAIADGMGGHAHGGLASDAAIESFFTAFYDSEPGLPFTNLRHAMEQANQAVCQAASRLNVRQMGTTLTVANLVNDCLYLAHVGDTRAYLIREGRATCLTNDHSVAGELVRLRTITPDEVRMQYERTLLTKHLGASSFIKPDLSQTTLQSDDVVILCSDGLWAFVEDYELAWLTTHLLDANELSRELIQVALQHQTDDNVSVIVVRVEQVTAPQTAASPLLENWQQVLSLT